MRRAARVDGNHSQMVAALRQAGVCVVDLSGVGKGCPDLLWSLAGRCGLIELKDPRQPKSRQRLRESQQAFKTQWQASYAVVGTLEQAFFAVGLRQVKTPTSGGS